MKDWLIVVLLVIIAVLMSYGLLVDHGPAPAPHADPSIPPTPTPVQILEPVPVVLVAPRPQPGPGPGPTPGPTPPSPSAADTQLSLAGRDYLRTIPTALPDIWIELADQIDQDRVTDKNSSVALHNTPSAGLNAALNQLYAPNIDSKGKITNKAAITGLLRQSAAALGRSR